MTTLNHPRVPNVTVEVPDSDVERWQASGWVLDGAFGYLVDDDADGSHLDAWTDQEATVEVTTDKPKRTRKK